MIRNEIFLVIYCCNIKYFINLILLNIIFILKNTIDKNKNKKYH